MVVIILLTLSFIVAGSLYTLSFIISRGVKNNNKISSFESGFSTVGTIYSSFSIHFFCILLIFIIFDLEIVLLVGCMVSINISTFMVVILLVVGGVYLEWYLGKLKWIV